MFSNLYKSRDWWLIAIFAAIAFIFGFYGFMHCGRMGKDGICQTYRSELAAGGNSTHRNAAIARADAAAKAGSDAKDMSPAAAVGSAVLNTIGLVRGARQYALGDVPPGIVIAQAALPLIFLLGAAKLIFMTARRDVRVAAARRERNHIIVCGLGETGRHIVASMRAADKTVVVITRDGDGINALACEKLGVAVLSGDGLHEGILARAGLKHAEAVVVATGSDGQNVEIALRASKYLEKQAYGTVKLLAEVRSGWLLDTIVNNSGAILGNRAVEVQLFNSDANAARLLLRSAAFQHAFLDDKAAKEPHLVMVGLGSAGLEFISRAITTNFALPDVRLSITVMDKKATSAEMAAAFGGHYTALLSLAEFSFRPCAFDSDGTESRSEIENVVGARRVDAVIVALPSDEASLRAALQFRAQLDSLNKVTTPVFVRLSDQKSLGDFLGRVESRSALPSRLVAFGDMEELTRVGVLLDQELDRLAHAFHETYLETANLYGKSAANVPWQNLPELFKASNRSQADHVPLSLAAAGLRLVRGAPRMELSAAQIDRLARAEHWRWCIERKAAGWRHGPEKNELLKLHPDLQEWDTLSESTRAGNRERLQPLPAIFSRIGAGVREFQVVRLGEMRGKPPAAAMDMVPAQKLCILVVDPLLPDDWAAAAGISAMREVRIWLHGTGSEAMKAVDLHLRDNPGVAPLIEGWLDS